MKLALYTAKTIASAIALVLIVFFCLFLFVALLSEFGSIGTGHYGFWQAFQFVVLSTPLSIYTIFPSIILIGVLLGLGSLASHNELMIFRTSGMSLFRIAKIILTTALLITIIMTLIGEGVAPKMARYAQNQKNVAQSNGQVITTLSGVWARKDNSFFHIARVGSSNHLYDVTYFQFNNQYQLVAARQAKSAERINGVWTFYNIQSSLFQGNTVQHQSAVSAKWPLDFNKHTFSNFDPSLQDLVYLYKQVEFVEASGGNANNYELTFWSRIFQPLTTLIMVLLAIPFIFGPLRSVSLGLRLLSGIMIGLIFFIMNRFLISFGLAYQIPPLVAASSLPALFFIFALYLFRRKQ